MSKLTAWSGRIAFIACVFVAGVYLGTWIMPCDVISDATSTLIGANSVTQSVASFGAAPASHGKQISTAAAAAALFDAVMPAPPSSRAAAGGTPTSREVSGDAVPETSIPLPTVPLPAVTDGVDGWHGIFMKTRTAHDCCTTVAWSPDGNPLEPPTRLTNESVDERPAAVASRPPTKIVKIDLEPIASEFQAGYDLRKAVRLAYPGAQAALRRDAKRVWFDLGARGMHHGSTLWFLRAMGPDSGLFHAHLFDVLDLASEYTPKFRREFASFEFSQQAVWVHDRGVSVRGFKMAHALDPANAYDPMQRPKENRPLWNITSTNFANFLASRYVPRDYVIVKMDIEGGEWEVLAHLIRTRAIYLVDELLLECHPRPIPTGPQAKYHQSCVDLTNHLRALGVLAHRWV